MLGRQGQQKSVFGVESWVEAGSIPETSVYWLLAHEQGHVAQDDEYEGMYGSRGRPSWPPSLMIKVLLLQLADGVGDREAEQRCRFDLRWKFALGLGLQEKGPDATTLCTFRARLARHERGRAALVNSLRWAKARGWIQASIDVIVDSLATAGAGAQQDTFTLIRKGLRLLARSVRNDEMHGGWAQELLAQPDRKPDVPWDDAAARGAALASLLEEADAALERTEGCHGIEVEQARTLLGRIIGQDVEVTEQGLQIRQGVAKDRICSVTDPEMRHGHKTSSGKFNGYKVDLGITGNQEFVTHATAIAANAPDGNRLAEDLHALEAELDVRVTQAMGDTAYGRPQVRDALEQQGRTLIAPVQPVPPNRGLFTKDHFRIDLEQRKCICPNGNVGRPQVDREGHLVAFQFSAKQCARCPLRPQCTTSRNGREVNLRRDEARRQQLRMEQATPEWRQRYRQRARVERTVAECKRFGLGKARYRGRAKLQLQAWLTAALVNFRRIARRLSDERPAVALGQ